MTTTNGERYVAIDDGDVQGPRLLDWAEWLVECGGGTLPDHQLNRLIDLIRNLQDVADATEVMRCVVPETTS